MTKLSSIYKSSAVRMALLATCTLAAGSVPSHAQDPSAPPPPATGHGRGGPEMQERQLEMMTRQLNLTPDQVTQVKTIQADGRKQMMALRDDTSTTGPDRHARMMAMREAEQAKVKALLTDEQKTKYDAMMERMKERRGHGPGGRGGPGGPGGPASPVGDPPAPPSAS